jgi:alanine racemase
LTEQEVPLAVAARATVTAWTPAFVRQLAKAAGRADHPLDVHVKLDTGLGRLGTRDPAEATAVSEMVASEPMLNLAGAWTHFATADQRGDEFFAEQLARFRAWIEPLRATHPNIVVHAANSAATLRDPAAHFDMVRCGVAIYGLDPFGENPASHGLLPALELHAAVAAVKSCATGESVGYGRRFVAEESTTIATIPVGYGDGYRRALSDRAEVLIGGHRYPVRGTISMDNTTVELGPASGISPGDEVTLLGRSGEEIITAEELASRSDTINYEITCAVTTRPSRLWHRDGVAVES